MKKKVQHIRSRMNIPKTMFSYKPFASIDLAADLKNTDTNPMHRKKPASVSKVYAVLFKRVVSNLLS